MLTKANKRDFADALIEYCAPVLAGIKVANLFRFQLKENENIKDVLKFWKNIFQRKGMDIVTIRKFPKEESYLFYVYRTKLLEEILQDEDTKNFLEEHGYKESQNIAQSIKKLSEAINHNSVFPHEIGIFLGYPLEDVKGFISHQGKNALCSGCWKVYANQGRAEECFSKYKICTKVLLGRYEKGQSIEELIVAA